MRIRSFKWSDVDALTRMLNDIGGLNGSAKAFDAAATRAMLSVPGADPERHCFIAEDDGEPLGYTLVSYEPPISRTVASGGVLQTHRRRGIGRALLRQAVEHAASLGVRALHVEARARDAEANRLLASEGLQVVKSYWQMRWQCDSVPDIALPPGFAVRPLVAMQDEQALTDLQNTSFGENWGFSPNTVEQIAARVRQNKGGPECILFITEHGEPAAYNWTMFLDEGAVSSGAISMTGVHPRYRGRGIGRAVVTAGIAYLVERGASRVELEVDSDNAPARELYLNLGFRKISKTVWYEKRFQNGS